MSNGIDKSTVKILISEDDALIAADLENHLINLGYTVCGVATSGIKALDLIERHQPDLVMMDIVLKGNMDGITLAEIIRDKWGIPVIFLTAYADTERLARAKMTYPFGYLLKPFHDRDLKITTEMALYVARVEKERSKAKNALIEESAWRRILVQGSRDGIVVLDQAGKVYEANQKFADLLGYDMEEVFDLYVWDWDDQWPREHLLEMIGTVDESGDHFETVHRRKDGSVVDVEISTNGAVRGGRKLVFCVCRDITERKKAEEALRQSEALLNATQRLSKVGGWEWDVKSKKVFWSNEVYRIHDFEPEEFEPGSPDHYTRSLECYRPEDRSVFADAFRKCAKEGIPYDLKFPITTAKGRQIWIRTTAEPAFEDGVVSRVNGAIIDITDQQQTEERIERFGRIFENSLNEILLFKTDDLKFTLTNKAAQKNLGYTQNEMIELRPFDIKPDFNEESFKRLITPLLTGEKEILVFETTHQRKDQSLYDVEVHLQLLRHENEALFAAIILDITDRKQSEAKQERLQAQLQQAKKMEAVGTLAGGVAHDFNNLLQVISGYTQVLLFDKKEGDPDHASLTAIYKAGERAAQLVRQLLLFSRKLETERKPVDINQEIERIRLILERTIPQYVGLELHLGNRLWIVNADRVQFEQVMLNLARNSSDSMPDGGKILISTENQTVVKKDIHPLLGAELGRYVVLTFTDTGQGMDEETVEHIFEPFYTTKETGKGTGLGLASVYGIVKSHGGYITCHSQIGLGTTFRIFLPSAEEIDPDSEKGLQLKSRQDGEVILLVDNDVSVRDFSSKVLKSFGYKVLTAGSEDQTMDIYLNKREEINLVILDIAMPAMGGHKCLQEILRINPHEKVIAAGGYFFSDQLKDLLEAGAAGFIRKPYRTEDMLEKVRIVLDEKM